MTRLVQLSHEGRRAVAIVEEPKLRLLKDYESIHRLASDAIEQGTPLTALIQKNLSDESHPYDDAYKASAKHPGPWSLMAPIDHPEDAGRLMVSGTGLTHLGSARSRDAMHERAAAQKEDTLTDSMKMFKWGLERGKPAAGQIGIAPEWFYKGDGGILRNHHQSLIVPAHALDGGEEAEVAGVYIIDSKGNPHRIGMAQGNEFSDHVFEKKNYLNLAGSKLRTCSIGPELVINPDFSRVPGTVAILRKGSEIWTKSIATGESEMSHSLANIEHHHFKFAGHRRPGGIHVHFFGACALSFGEGIKLESGDVMRVQFTGFGRPLENDLEISQPPEALIAAQPLT